MIKKLQIVALAMLFAMTGTSFIVEAKGNDCAYSTHKACNNHKGSCHWNGKCRKGADTLASTGLPAAQTGTDASQVPATSAIIVNNTNTPPNAATITFYDKNKVALTAPTTIFYGGQYAVIPTSAAFITATYVASNDAHDIIKVIDMININQTGVYTLINPNSSNQPADSPAAWLLTTPVHIYGNSIPSN
jgi:hypothetical protein